MKNVLLQLLAIPLFCSAQKTTEYKNLVFEGGGARGMAYAGVIKALDEKNILPRIERTAGSSAGAIAALLVSLNYSTTEIDSLLGNLSMQSFNDGKWIFIGGIARMKKNYGWYRGNEFEKWISEIIAHKTGRPDLNFEELHQLVLAGKKLKDFYCTGTNLNMQRTEIFGYTSTPSMKISTAVRISISIPVYFGAVFLNENLEAVKPRKKTNYTVYVDGGLLANYPLAVFDSCAKPGASSFNCDIVSPNLSTLGIKLERPEQIDSVNAGNNILAPFKINNAKNYVSALYNLLFETVNKQSNEANENERTIYISTSNISPRIKRLRTEDKNTLVQNGYKGVNDFFAAQN